MKDEKVYLPISGIDTVSPILDKISLFGGLTEKQLSLLLSLLEEVSYEEGETVFSQGSTPNYIYIVKNGKIKFVYNDNQTSYELIEFDTGGCFGETSVIGIQPHTASAIAVEKTKLIVLSRKALFAIYKMDLELYSMLIMNIAREACRRLNKTDEVLLHYTLKKKK